MAWIKALGGTGTVNVSGSYGAIAPYNTMTENLINSKSQITGTVVVEMNGSTGPEYCAPQFIIGGVTYTLTGVSGSTKTFSVNLATTPGETVVLSVTNNTSNFYILSVTWNLDFS